MRVEEFDAGMDMLDSALEILKMVADGDQILFGAVKLLEMAEEHFKKYEGGEDLELFPGTLRSLEDLALEAGVTE